jgi:tetratricopeptide (TPR) repeat protein
MAPEQTEDRPQIFLSYGHRDAAEIAGRLCKDLEKHYRVWQDKHDLRVGRVWTEDTKVAITASKVLIALLSPHAVRTSSDPGSADGVDSTCLDEIHYARYSCKRIQILPVMVIACEPPFCIYRLQFVNMCGSSGEDALYKEGVKEILAVTKALVEGKEPRYRTWASSLRPVDFSDFLSSARKRFIGREWMFRLVQQWLEVEEECSLLITGDPGMGKSSLAAELVRRNPGGRLLAFYCCDPHRRTTLQPGRFVRTLAAMVASRLEAYELRLDDPEIRRSLEEADKDPVSAFATGVVNPLYGTAFKQQGTRYVLIDALDEALGWEGGGPSIVDVLVSRIDRLPSWLRLIATTRKVPGVLEPLKTLRRFELAPKDDHNTKDLQDYIAMRFDERALRELLRNSGLSPDSCTQRLLEKSEGNFLYAQLALDGLIRGNYSLASINELPPGLGNLYRTSFEDHFESMASYESLRRILEVMTAAREPIGGSTLAKAANIDSEHDLRRLMSKIAVFLREDSGSDSNAFYHGSFAEWLTDPSQPYFADPQRGHESLASAGWKEFIDDPRALSSYLVRHLPYHMAQAGRFDDLSKLLESRELNLMSRWVEMGETDDGKMCLAGIIDHLIAKGGAKTRIAGLLTQLGRIHSLLGEYDQASECFERAFHMTSWYRGRRARGVASHELGSIYLYRGQYNLAEQAFKRALRITRWSIPVQRDEVAANLVALATTYKARHEYPRALQVANEALREAQRARDIRHAFASERLLLNANIWIADLAAAREHLVNARMLLLIGKLDWERGGLTASHGWLEYDEAILDKEQPTRSYDRFIEALQASENAKDFFYTLDAKRGLGWASLACGRAAEATDWFKQIERTIKGADLEIMRASSKVGLAAACHSLGRLEEAEKMYEDTLASFEGSQLWMEISKAYVGLGAIHWHADHGEMARDAWTRALEAACKISPERKDLFSVCIEICKEHETEPPR